MVFRTAHDNQPIKRIIFRNINKLFEFFLLFLLLSFKISIQIAFGKHCDTCKHRWHVDWSDKMTEFHEIVIQLISFRYRDYKSLDGKKSLNWIKGKSYYYTMNTSNYVVESNDFTFFVFFTP